MKRFAELTEQEILALAITNEDEDSRIYRGFAEGLRDTYPASAKVFDEMAEEEVRHRTMLFDLYRSKFGEYLPLIRRQDVKGFIQKKPLWLMHPLNLDEVRKFAENMEYEAARFYRRATETSRDTSVRQLLVELAEAEVEHESLAHQLGQQILTPSARATEDETARRMFLLQYVQPGLAGLMDGSVSTLAPLFAAAFATHNTWETFLVGRCPISFPISGPRPPSPSPWSRSSSWPSPTSVTALWTRRSSRRHSKSLSGARWCSSQGF